MLNLLIALLSESHGEVMQLEQQASVYEKLQLILSLKTSFLVLIQEKSRKSISSISQENALNEYVSFLKRQTFGDSSAADN